MASDGRTARRGCGRGRRRSALSPRGVRVHAASRAARPLLLLPLALGDLGAPVYGDDLTERDDDLTCRHDGRPLGQRIVVSGRVLEEDGRPVRDSLIEIWQANAAGRYRHDVDRHDAPLDPNFDGAGRCLTDSEGRYRFVTVKPGAYPWPNHANAWRPGAHPLLALRARVLAAARDADVLPGRPAVPVRPDLRLDPRPERARSG